MNGFVVLAACVCATSAQVLVGGIAGAINPAPSTQFHAQDEFGQFSFGYAGGPSAKTEARNAFGVTTGSYQYVDANGLLQTVNYVADPVNGFRVAGTNLPVAPGAPAAPEVTPLVAPVHTLANVEDTAEVAAAKAEFQAAFDAAAAAAAAAPEERKKREAEPQVVLGGLPYAGLPYAAAALPAAVPALAPVGAVPHVPTVKSDVVTPAEVSHEVSHVAVPAVAPLAVGYYGKRSADAEPEAEADADALYGYYGYPYGYRAYGYGYGYPYRYGYYGKRSADAEPQVLAYAGLPYAAALPAAVPALAPVGAVPHVPTVKSDVVTPAEVSHEVTHTTHAVPLAVGYAGFYGKRSAEPQVVAAAAYPYAVAGYPYTYAGYPYAAVPFGSSTGADALTQGLDPITQGADPVTQGAVIAKRSAEAEADAFYAPYAYAHVPFGSSSGLDPITQGLDPATQGFVPYYGYGYHGLGYAYWG